MADPARDAETVGLRMEYKVGEAQAFVAGPIRFARGGSLAPENREPWFWGERSLRFGSASLRFALGRSPSRGGVSSTSSPPSLQADLRRLRGGGRHGAVG